FITLPPPPEIYTLSLHDALPILPKLQKVVVQLEARDLVQRRERLVHQKQARLRHHGAGDGDAHLHAARKLARHGLGKALQMHARSEEHTSELQSRENLVCRLLLE